MKEVEGMRDSARQKEIDAINTMLRRMNKQLYEVKRVYVLTSEETL